MLHPTRANSKTHLVAIQTDAGTRATRAARVKNWPVSNSRNHCSLDSFLLALRVDFIEVAVVRMHHFSIAI